MKQHTYQVRVNWTGNAGEGTKNYKSYRRDLTIESPGKPPIRGDPSRYNPEDLLVASLSSCHMLWYLHLCAVNHLTVVDYEDRASGVMQEHDDGSGEFVSVQLKPSIRILAGDDREKALALHAEAHHLCFVARSVNFPVEVVPEILDAGSSAASNG
jgi:organic hydroperoxide reductase OsmC/OhrA